MRQNQAGNIKLDNKSFSIPASEQKKERKHFSFNYSCSLV